jgi:DNA repair protein RadD
MARPTVSQVLYEQMIGRGLRGPKFGGTATCVIIDLEDKYRSERPSSAINSSATFGVNQFALRP